jgi:putative zinc finger protein
MTSHDSGRCAAYPASTLSAFVDGDLTAGEAQAVRAHGAACPRCGALIAELAALVAAARGLDRPEPPPTLWPAVEGTLARQERQERMDRRDRIDRPWWLSLRLFGGGALAGAAAVSIVALGLSSWRAHRAAAFVATPATVAAADPLLAEAETEFARAAAAYESSIEKLRGLLAREEPRWSAEERALYAERLVQLDEAIARSQDLARRSPADSTGNEQLFAAYQQKISFLAAAVHRGGAWGESRSGDPSRNQETP